MVAKSRRGIREMDGFYYALLLKQAPKGSGNILRETLNHKTLVYRHTQFPWLTIGMVFPLLAAEEIKIREFSFTPLEMILIFY